MKVFVRSCLAAALCFISLISLSQQTKVDSLSLALKNAKQDTTRASILVALTEELFYSNPDTVIPMCKKAIEIADKNSGSSDDKTKISFLKSKADALNNIGFCLMQNGDYSNAMVSLQDALEIRKQIGDKKGMASTFINMGAIHDDQGEIQKALNLYREALEIQKVIGDKEGAAQSFHNIGFIYNNLDDIEQALNYYDKSIQVRREIGDNRGIANTYNNMAIIYVDKKDFQKAMEYAEKSLKIRQDMGDQKKIAMSFGVLANIHDKKGDPAKAWVYFDKSLKLHEETNNKMGIAFCLSAMSDFYVKLAESGDVSKKKFYYQQALTYATRSLLISKELASPKNIKNAEKSLSNIHSILGNTSEAFEHYKQFIIYKDSLDNEGNRKAGMKSQLKYEFDIKEAISETEHKKELENQEALAAERSKKQEIIIWAVAGSFLLAMLFAGYVLRTLRVTRRQKQIIEAKNEETEFQKLIIEEKQKEIIDSINYARRIQQSQFPTEKYIHRSLKRLKK